MSKCSVELGVSGHYKFSIKRADGSVDVVAEFSNLITNQGLNRLIGTTSTFLTYMSVGTGNTPPAVTDTGLDAFLMSTQTNNSSAYSYDATAGFKDYTIEKRFLAATADALITEVGMGWGATDGSLFCRALVKDNAGQPISIPVSVGEQVYLEYRLRYFFPVSDQTGTVDGFNYTLRASKLSHNTYWNPIYNGRLNSSYLLAYGSDATLGDVNGIPTGDTSYTENSRQDFAYVTDSFSRTSSIKWGSNYGNDANGLGAFSFVHGPACWQMSVSPSIDKNTSNELSLQITTTWARR